MGRYTRRSWTDWGRWWGVRLPFLCALWMTSFAQNSRRGPVNIATGLRDSAYQQSSKHPSQRHASNGANGNTDGRYSADNCVHTYNYIYSQSQRRHITDKTPWWEVNLDRPTYVYNIKIWGRTGQIPRLYPFTIRVDGKLCVYVTQNPGTREITVNCTTPLYGQVVRLTRSTKQEDFTLNMCEFQILVCQAGYYGMDCSLPCSNYCTSDGCYMNNGTCISCNNGAWGNECQNACGHCDKDTCDMYTGACSACKPGWYGDQCLTRCPSHCLECDQRSGVCLDCEGNFAGDSCTDCNSGMYGESCQHTCSSKTAKCERCDRDGRCTSCVNNFKPPNCTECVEGYYRKSISKCWRCSSNCASRSCNPETGKCNECPDGRHGDQCNLTCPQSCVRCEQDSGQCTECDFNRQPPDCVECLDGYYKLYKSSRWCTQCRGTCLKGTVCDKTSGHCPACPPGKRGTLCHLDCGPGTYGQNCSQQCGRCGQSSTCDVMDGFCQGCQIGWQMPLCQEKCKDGTYGDGCRQACGHCKDNSPCNNVNGGCQQCQPGWYPPLCARPCQDGRFGMNCTQSCGNCLHGVVCNKTNGHCPCPLGKQPPLCDTNCQNNTYGQDCREKCGQCREGSACEPTNGHCAKGCQPGWIDPAGLTVHLCKSACPAGLYGDQCNQTCGYCHSSSPCHHVTGECQQGCAKGFTGVYCMEVSKEGLSTGALIGIIVVVVVVLIIVAVVIVIILKKQKGQGRKGTSYRGVSRELSWSRDGLTDPPDPSILSTTSLSLPPPPESVSEKPVGIPQAQVKPAVRPKTNQSSKTNGAIYENVTILNSNAQPAIPSSASADVQRHKIKTLPKPEASGSSEPKETPVEALTDDEADFEFDEAVYANAKTHEDEPPTSIRLDMLQETVLDRLGHGQLDEEFLRMLPKKDYPTASGNRRENYYKNRFKSILPYDKNRVVLAELDGKDGSDYINASFVKGYKTDRDFIAAQGPKVNTADDWWRMIWQEGVTDVVMLTSPKEGHKEKCYKYWPDSGDFINTGHVLVTAKEVHHRAHFILREFDIRGLEGYEPRRVTQYHYLGWMDHEVPATTPLVNFWRYVSARAARSVSSPPLLVHCSAGVGRTGTYIALDIALAHAREEAEVDLYNVVDCLRDDRCHMVQNKNQYAFLYEAVLEAYLSENTRVQSVNFNQVFPRAISRDVPNPRIDEEFQNLCKMRNSLTTPSYTNGTQAENVAKNRNPDALPDDKHLVFLTQHVKGRNQYINAVYMPTFLQARGSITTQLPLPDTLVDMWRLIDGCDVNIVVSLGDVEGQKDMCRYWPKLGESLKTGIYTISVQSVAQIGESLDSYILTMQKQKGNGESREVRVLHLKGWNEQGKENTNDLMDVLDILCSSCNNTSKPVVVQCIDGAASSGQFCALWEAVKRLKCDGEVDMYLAARQVTTVTPLAFTAAEEYRYCYEVVQACISAQSIYANA